MFNDFFVGKRMLVTGVAGVKGTWLALLLLTLEKLVDLYNGHLQKASYIAALRFMMDENIVKLNARNELEKV